MSNPGGTGNGSTSKMINQISGARDILAVALTSIRIDGNGDSALEVAGAVTYQKKQSVTLCHIASLIRSATN